MPPGQPTNSDFEHEDFDAPRGLVRGLRQLRNKAAFVPPTVDEAVLRAARQHFARPPRKSWRWMILIPSFGVAALIAILGIFWHRNPSSPAQPQLAREDINQDGRVDILDAFALAREIKTRATLTASDDVNGDGVVDEKDVEIIAARAVKLERDNRS
jgi:hypothetical protein